MAVIKFFVRGKSNPAKITARFIENGNNHFARTIPVFINPAFFNNNSGRVRNIAHHTEKDEIQNTLNDFNVYVLKEYTKANNAGYIVNSDWLEKCINQFFQIVEQTDLNLLSNYSDFYIKKLQLKRNDKTGGLGSSKATVSKYATIKNKILSFEKHTGKRYQLTDVNTAFRNEFLTYLLDVEQLSRNTSGRYLGFLKTVVLDAKKEGYKVSPQLSQFKAFKVKVKSIYLSIDELETIEATRFKDDSLNIARDWLLIGCYIGQRAGDLLRLTKDNLTNIGGLECIELEQQKTKKRVLIPLHQKVKDILQSRNGNFPPSYGKTAQSAITIFNRKIKQVCLKSGLTTPTTGAKVNPDTNRKEKGQFPKWQLVTSHICRRSFASNNYGKIPTPVLMQITAHATETQFLEYIGKTSLDYAEQLAKYWEIEQQKRQSTPHLKAVK